MNKNSFTEETKQLWNNFFFPKSPNFLIRDCRNFSTCINRRNMTDAANRLAQCGAGPTSVTLLPPTREESCRRRPYSPGEERLNALHTRAYAELARESPLIFPKPHLQFFQQIYIVCYISRGKFCESFIAKLHQVFEKKRRQSHGPRLHSALRPCTTCAMFVIQLARESH